MSWVKQTGKLGGTYWFNTETNEKRYQQEKPAEDDLYQNQDDTQGEQQKKEINPAVVEATKAFSGVPGAEKVNAFLATKFFAEKGFVPKANSAAELNKELLKHAVGDGNVDMAMAEETAKQWGISLQDTLSSVAKTSSGAKSPDAQSQPQGKGTDENAQAASPETPQQQPQQPQKPVDEWQQKVQSGLQKWKSKPPFKVSDLDAADYSKIPGWKVGPLKQAYGMVLFDDQGRVLLREPTGHFGGTAWTFAKGGGIKPASTATKELAEETGYSGHIYDMLPDAFVGSTSKTNFFLGKAYNHDPSLMDNETSDLKWVTYDEAVELIKQSTNKKVVERDLDLLKKSFEAMGKSDGSLIASIGGKKYQNAWAAVNFGKTPDSEVQNQPVVAPQPQPASQPQVSAPVNPPLDAVVDKLANEKNAELDQSQPAQPNPANANFELTSDEIANLGSKTQAQSELQGDTAAPQPQPVVEDPKQKYDISKPVSIDSAHSIASYMVGMTPEAIEEIKTSKFPLWIAALHHMVTGQVNGGMASAKTLYAASTYNVNTQTLLKKKYGLTDEQIENFKMNFPFGDMRFDEFMEKYHGKSAPTEIPNLKKPFAKQAKKVSASQTQGSVIQQISDEFAKQAKKVTASPVQAPNATNELEYSKAKLEQLKSMFPDKFSGPNGDALLSAFENILHGGKVGATTSTPVPKSPQQTSKQASAPQSYHEKKIKSLNDEANGFLIGKAMKWLDDHGNTEAHDYSDVDVGKLGALLGDNAFSGMSQDQLSNLSPEQVNKLLDSKKPSKGAASIRLGDLYHPEFDTSKLYSSFLKKAIAAGHGKFKGEQVDKHGYTETQGDALKSLTKTVSSWSKNPPAWDIGAVPLSDMMRYASTEVPAPNPATFENSKQFFEAWKQNILSLHGDLDYLNASKSKFAKVQGSVADWLESDHAKEHGVWQNGQELLAATSKPISDWDAHVMAGVKHTGLPWKHEQIKDVHNAIIGSGIPLSTVMKSTAPMCAVVAASKTVGFPKSAIASKETFEDALSELKSSNVKAYMEFMKQAKAAAAIYGKSSAQSQMGQFVKDTSLKHVGALGIVHAMATQPSVLSGIDAASVMYLDNDEEIFQKTFPLLKQLTKDSSPDEVNQVKAELKDYIAEAKIKFNETADQDKKMAAMYLQSIGIDSIVGANSSKIAASNFMQSKKNAGLTNEQIDSGETFGMDADVLAMIAATNPDTVEQLLSLGKDGKDTSQIMNAAIDAMDNDYITNDIGFAAKNYDLGDSHYVDITDAEKAAKKPLEALTKLASGKEKTLNYLKQSNVPLWMVIPALKSGAIKTVGDIDNQFLLDKAMNALPKNEQDALISKYGTYTVGDMYSYKEDKSFYVKPEFGVHGMEDLPPNDPHVAKLNEASKNWGELQDTFGQSHLKKLESVWGAHSLVKANLQAKNNGYTGLAEFMEKKGFSEAPHKMSLAMAKLITDYDSSPMNAHPVLNSDTESMIDADGGYSLIQKAVKDKIAKQQKDWEISAKELEAAAKDDIHQTVGDKIYDTYKDEIVGKNLKQISKYASSNDVEKMNKVVATATKQMKKLGLSDEVISEALKNASENAITFASHESASIRNFSDYANKTMAKHGIPAGGKLADQSVFDKSKAVIDKSPEYIKGWASITPAEQNALIKYMGSWGYGSESINKDLRACSKCCQSDWWGCLGKKRTKSEVDAVRAIGNAMAKMPTLKEPIVVGRGIKGEHAKLLMKECEEILKNNGTGHVVMDGFVSSTYSRELAKTWGGNNIAWQLIVKKALPAYKISSGEGEFILPHGMKFKPLAVHKNSAGRYTVTLEQITDGNEEWSEK